jgi:hypothetical protein
MINIADFFADIYGKKCNTSKIGEVGRSTIHIPLSQDGAFFTNKKIS